MRLCTFIIQRTNLNLPTLYNFYGIHTPRRSAFCLCCLRICIRLFLLLWSISCIGFCGYTARCSRRRCRLRTTRLLAVMVPVVEESSCSRTAARTAADGWTAKHTGTASARARVAKASSLESGRMDMRRPALTPGRTVRCALSLILTHTDIRFISHIKTGRVSTSVEDYVQRVLHFSRGGQFLRLQDIGGPPLSFPPPFSFPLFLPPSPSSLPSQLPPLIQLGVWGVGERCELPQQGRAEPGHQTHFGAFWG